MLGAFPCFGFIGGGLFGLIGVLFGVRYINLEPEAPLEIPDAPIPAGWPENGEIEFK